jgi:peptidoglycan/LPS O-acetylase OafA/YrhL
MPAPITANSSSPARRTYFPGLDGLRGIAFLMIFCFHYLPPVVDLPGVRWGWIGVDLFFVLSGFLITGILYDSLSSHTFFKTFYIRRSLRIFPLYFGFWLLLLLATPWLHFQWNRYNVAVIMYVGNYLVPDTPAARHYIDPFILAFTAKHMLGGAPRIITFAHLWSLTVEEQFYCIWPAVVWMVRKRGRLLTLCLVVVAAMPFLRLLFSHFVGSGVAGGAVYGSLFFRMDTLLFGGALALWLRGTSLSAATIRKGARTTAIVAPTIFIVGYYLCPSPGDATFLVPSCLHLDTLSSQSPQARYCCSALIP